MFDIGFTELLLIAVIGLLVIGPKRLPEVARTLGRWTAKLRNFVAATRADLEREFNSTELRQLLDDKQGEIDELRQMITDTRNTLKEGVQDLEKSVDTLADDSQPEADNTIAPFEDAPVSSNDIAPERTLTDVQKQALTANKPKQNDPDA